MGRGVFPTEGTAWARTLRLPRAHGEASVAAAEGRE